MKFDIVFDVQEAYRKVLHAFSYPGEIVSLQKEADNIALDMKCMSATKLLMYMLLDADTTFHIVEKETELATTFSQVTYCVHVPASQANFVFIPKENNEQVQDIMSSLMVGTLENPHKSACLIVECEQICTQKMYTLKGPGIKDTNAISISLPTDWIEIRKQVNCEFPLGIDMIFVDEIGNCIALPRTTQIERVK